MSTFEVKMPKLGESITQGTIMRWAVKVGDRVEEDNVLFEVSTEKVSAEIPSPVSGKILEIRFAENDVVPVGSIVAIIELENDTISSTPVPAPSSGVELLPDTNSFEHTGSSIPDVLPVPAGEKRKAGRFYSPLVRNIAQAENISGAELETIQGTGFQGRVSKADVLQYLEQRQTGGKTTIQVDKKSGEQGSGKIDGQADRSYIASETSSDTVVEMDRVRRIIADHMVMSKNVSAHVATFVDVDVTRLVQWREHTKDDFFRREGVKLTYMPVIVEACVKALIDFPRINASVDGHNIILKKHINIGIAVALDDGNLIVPVVHDADKLNINGLAIAVDTLAAKARNNKLAPDDIQGGTFTITNFGTFKNIFGTPIINQPQVAILGVGYIEKRPAVMETPEGDMIAIRHKMYLSLSYDHRIVDGALGGAFLRRVADYLEMERS